MEEVGFELGFWKMSEIWERVWQMGRRAFWLRLGKAQNEYVKVKIWFDLHHLCSHSCVTPPCSCHSCPLCLSRCPDQKKKKTSVTFRATSLLRLPLIRWTVFSSTPFVFWLQLYLGTYNILICCIGQLLYYLSPQLDCKFFRTGTIFPPVFLSLYHFARNNGLYQESKDWSGRKLTMDWRVRVLTPGSTDSSTSICSVNICGREWGVWPFWKPRAGTTRSSSCF